MLHLYRRELLMSRRKIGAVVAAGAVVSALVMVSAAATSPSQTRPI